jgi:hypothetical protein
MKTGQPLVRDWETEECYADGAAFITLALQTVIEHLEGTMTVNQSLAIGQARTLLPQIKGEFGR